MKVVLVILFAILADAWAAGDVYTPVARSYVPIGTHAAQTYVETVPATVQTASVVPVPHGNPSSQYHAQDSSGQYSYGYVTADGQSKVENKAVDGTVSGQYSYFDPEGKKVELNYIADKGGFRASGDHLPVAPEVPDLPDSLEDAYEEATGRLASASFKTLAVSPQTYSYNVQPASYATYPATPYTRGYQYYTNVGSSYDPGYVQRYTYGTPSGYQRYRTYPSYQYYTTSGYPTSYQSYTSGRPTGFQYYTSSYAPYNTYPTTYNTYTPTRYTYSTPTRYTYSTPSRYIYRPSTGAIRYTHSPTRYAYSPTRYSNTPTSYTGGKSGYSSYAYSY